MSDKKDAPDQVTSRATPPVGLTPLRHSQLSDSGAESCYEGDEQSRLIRSPSARTHKFIIIPATPGSPPGTISGPTPFRQTSSTTALAAMAASFQKQPPNRQTSVKSRPSSEVLQPAQHQQQQQLQPQPPAGGGSNSTVTFTIDDCDGEPPAPLPPISPTPATLTCTTTTTMAGDGMAVSPLSFDLRSRIGSHHSSMRSVVSGWFPIPIPLIVTGDWVSKHLYE